ncbi:hypothetical protein FRC01_012183 [Tulasnella sp. 417]|nr:hypothetical protein FRC01_012183 [Tulasnella sp. 417]
MSPISYVPRQVLGTGVVCCLFFLLTIILLTGLTGCTDASTTGVFSLVALVSLTLATHVVDKEFVAGAVLRVVLDLSTIALEIHGAALGSSIQYASDKLVDLCLLTLATALTTMAEIRKTIDFIVDIFILIHNSSSPIESDAELQEGDPFTSKKAFSPPPSRGGPDVHTDATATNPSLAPLPPLADTPQPHSNATQTCDIAQSGDGTNASNAKLINSATSPDEFPTVLGGNDGDDCHEITSCSTLASGPMRSNQPNHGVVVKNSSVESSSLPDSPADDGSTSQMGPDVFDLPQPSPKTTQNSLGLINVETPRGPIVAATACGQPPSTILPHIVIDEEFSSSSSSTCTSPSSHAPTGFSSPSSPSTVQTTPCSTQLDLHSDVERETPPSFIFTRSDVAEVGLAETEERDMTCAATSDSEPEQTHVGGHRADRCAEASFAPLNITKYDKRRSWATREAKLSEGGRQIRSNLLPKAPPPALVGWAGEHDRLDEDGDSQAEVMQDILKYIRSPAAPEPLREAPAVDKGRSSNLGRRPATRARPSVLSWRVSDDEVAIFGWGPLSTAASRRPLTAFAPTTPSSVKTDTKNKGRDEEGFGRRVDRRTIAKSKLVPSTHASAKPVSGASTSDAQNQPLPQEGRGILEESEALQPNPKEVIKPQSPVLTRFKEEIVMPCCPSASSLDVLEPAPGKKKWVFRWKKFIKKLDLRNPF